LERLKTQAKVGRTYTQDETLVRGFGKTKGDSQFLYSVARDSSKKLINIGAKPKKAPDNFKLLEDLKQERTTAEIYYKFKI